MKYRFKDVVDSLEYNELVSMKEDIENGGFSLKEFLNQKIDERKLHHEEECSTCGSTLDPKSTNNYTLVFGPHDFKKKASFCALDCMEHFVQELKDIKKVVY